MILDPNNPIKGLNDSKKLTEKKRELLYLEIIAKALDYCIIHISPQEVDKINILEARKLGMAKAIAELKKVDYAIFDGNFLPPNVSCESDYLVKGDQKVACISTASILAKVTRDRLIDT